MELVKHCAGFKPSGRKRAVMKIKGGLNFFVTADSYRLMPQDDLVQGAVALENF